MPAAGDSVHRWFRSLIEGKRRREHRAYARSTSSSITPRARQVRRARRPTCPAAPQALRAYARRAAAAPEYTRPASPRTSADCRPAARVPASGCGRSMRMPRAITCGSANTWSRRVDRTAGHAGGFERRQASLAACACASARRSAARASSRWRTRSALVAKARIVAAHAARRRRRRTARTVHRCRPRG